MNTSAVIFILSSFLLYPKVASLHLFSSDGSLHIIIPQDTIISRDVIIPQDSGPYEKAPTVLKKVDPDYPKEALKDSLEGSVMVKVRVNASGRVIHARIVASDNVIFNNAALKAARKWIFTPAILKGKPVNVWVSIPFHFSLKPKKSTGPMSARPDSINPEIHRALLRLKDNRP
jgi:TonB family protein